MFDSKVALYIVAEMAVLLLFFCVFLIFHISKLRKLIGRLEEKVKDLRVTLTGARDESNQARAELAALQAVEPKNYLDYLDSEIESTRSYHQQLNPDRDLVLDITPDAPMERQAASLRHAFLIAEKEARYAGDDDNPSWDVLQAKLQQIITFYAEVESSASEASEIESDAIVEESETETATSDEVAVYRKRIENLERFKTLFFEMETKWESAKADADKYYEQLMQLGLQLGGGEHYKSLLDGFFSSFDDLGNSIRTGAGAEDKKKSPARDADDVARGKPSLGKIVIANQEEIQRLKNMAVDQHKLITELKKQLYEVDTQEGYEAVIQDMSKQLDKQQRFIQESETCAQLLEDELTRSLENNRQLKQELEQLSTSAKQSDSESTEELIGSMTSESKKMLETIMELESQNSELKEKLKRPGGDTSEKTVGVLKEKLSGLQQELLNLQTQHIELEERYLELKAKK